MVCNRDIFTFLPLLLLLSSSSLSFQLKICRCINQDSLKTEWLNVEVKAAMGDVESHLVRYAAVLNSRVQPFFLAGSLAPLSAAWLVCLVQIYCGGVGHTLSVHSLDRSRKPGRTRYEFAFLVDTHFICRKFITKCFPICTLNMYNNLSMFTLSIVE
jgi:hypothetical protein